MTPTPTPGQTVGPFFAFALVQEGGADLVPPGHPGAIRLTGRVLDGAGDPVPDALVEIWQPGPDGAVVHEPGSLQRDGFTFTGWGRAPTDRTGRYTFTTLAPGATTPGGAPYFAVTVLARGLLDRLLTRAYPSDADGLDDDALLSSVGERRDTLVAVADAQGYRFDIRLQGEGETVFLTHPGA